MKKNTAKLVLDGAILILMLFMYKKNSISLMFHEVAGLCAIALMLVHLALNFLWVKGISAKLFSAELSARARISYAVNALMFLALAVLLASSVLISKKLFRLNAAPVWIRIHFCAAWVLLSLVGLHLGLHFSYIKNTLAIKSKAFSIVFVGVFALLALCGVHSIFTSGYIAQIAAPFAGQTAAKSRAVIGSEGAHGGMHGTHGEGIRNGQGEGMGGGRGKMPQSGRGMHGERSANGGAHLSAQFSPAALLKTLWQVTTITAFYAMLSFSLSAAAKHAQAKKLPPPQASSGS